MGARHKLNKVAIQGALIVGAIIGLAADSPLIGLITIGALLALCFVTGDIRLDRDDHRNQRNRRR